MRTYKPLNLAQKARKSITQKAWRAKHKIRLTEQRKARAPQLKDIRLRSRYGITMAQFQACLAEQKGRCKICRKFIVGAPHVDHDHITKTFRGILCELCNKGLGQFKDDIKIVRAAARYLAKAASEARGPESLIQTSTRAQGPSEAAR